MKTKKVVYVIYTPDGIKITQYDTLKEAKAFIAGLNWATPSWYYDELYRMNAEIINV